MNEQELNKKLAKWLFPYPEFRVEVRFYPTRSSIWIDRLFTEEAMLRVKKAFGKCALEIGTYYSHEVISSIFTNSLDACFKWFVPKLFTWSIGKNWELQKDFTIIENGIKASIDLHWIDPDKYDRVKPSEAIAETPALALCLAIEKLIDEGAK